MILAPKNPTSLTGMAFPTLFRAGNLYLRVPQIRAERTVAEGQMGQLRVVGGILAPIAGDTAGAKGYQLCPHGAGERSRTPGFQSRLSWAPTPEVRTSSLTGNSVCPPTIPESVIRPGSVLAGQWPRTSTLLSGGLASAVNSSPKKHRCVRGITGADCKVQGRFHRRSDCCHRPLGVQRRIRYKPPLRPDPIPWRPGTQHRGLWQYDIPGDAGNCRILRIPPP